MHRPNFSAALNLPQKWLWTGLILSMLLGYGFAMLQIGVTAGFESQTIFEHFRGNEAEMLPPMSFDLLVKLSHIHMLGMPLILTPAAWFFCRVPWPSSSKRAMIIVLGYLGILFDIVAWWGLVYLGKGFIALLFLGGLSLGSSLLLMSVADILFLWRRSNLKEFD